MNRQRKSPVSWQAARASKGSGKRHLLLDYNKKTGNIQNYHLFALLGQAFCNGEYKIVDSLYDRIRANQGGA